MSQEQVRTLNAASGRFYIGAASRVSLTVRILPCQEDIESSVAHELPKIAHAPIGVAPEPPRCTEFLAILLTDERRGSALVGDLNEGFQNDLASGMSVERANARYRAAVIRTIGPLLLIAAKRIGFFGILADYARRHFR